MMVGGLLSPFAAAYGSIPGSIVTIEPVSVVQQSPGYMANVSYMVRANKRLARHYYNEFFNNKEEIKAYKKYLEDYNKTHNSYTLEPEITNVYKTKVKDKYGVVSDIIVTKKLDKGDNKSITKHILPYKSVSYAMDDYKVPIYFGTIKDTYRPDKNTGFNATTEREDKRPGIPSKSEIFKNEALNTAGFLAVGTIATAAADLIIQKKFDLGRWCSEVHPDDPKR